MDDASGERTTFVCPFGKFKYCRMPFGLKNAPAIFQEAVSKVLEPVKSKACNYIDDVVVFSPDWKQHLCDLESVVSCLGKAGFTLKLKKCRFGKQYLTYLGHKIGDGKVSVPRARIQAMADYIRPNTKKQLRAFLGSVSFYRKFIEGFAELSSHLMPAVSSKAPRGVEWTPAMISGFGENSGGSGTTSHC